MNITLENIGLLKSANIDLEKNLIVVAGPNNSGKTYLTYSLYGTLRFLTYPGFWDTMLSDILLRLPLNSEFRPGRNNLELNIKDISHEIIIRFNTYLTNENLSATILAQTFGANASTYSGSTISLYFLKEEIANAIIQTFYSSQEALIEIESLWSTGTKAKFYLAEKKFIRAEIDNLENAPSDITAERVREMIVGLLSRSIPDYLLTSFTFFATSERNSIDLFSKEIITSRLIRADRRGRDRIAFGQESSNLVQEDFVYSLPIQNSLLFAEKLPEYAKRQGPLSFIADEIESEILHGSMQIDTIGSISFIPSGSSTPISLQLSSSIVKSLASIIFFCRHLARPGMTFFMDEPEMNLHPDNQRKIARILVKLANAGIKVIISTHSDYVLLELNNMIMLGSTEAIETRNELMKTYSYNSSHLLSKDKIGVYMCSVDGQVQNLEVSSTGFTVETIYDEIDNLSQASKEIFFELYG